MVVYNIFNYGLLPPDRTVKGHELITYFNNSPDTLKKAETWKTDLKISIAPGLHGFGNAGDDYLNARRANRWFFW